MTHRRSLIVQHRLLPYRILHLAGGDETSLADLKIVSVMGSKFFQNTFRHKLSVTARSEVGDCIRTSAKLFYDRVLPAVRRQRIAVFKHIISLLSPLLYTL